MEDKTRKQVVHRCGGEIVLVADDEGNLYHVCNNCKDVFELTISLPFQVSFNINDFEEFIRFDELIKL